MLCKIDYLVNNLDFRFLYVEPFRQVELGSFYL